jgi:hypothetical protein
MSPVPRHCWIVAAVCIAVWLFAGLIMRAGSSSVWEILWMAAPFLSVVGIIVALPLCGVWLDVAKNKASAEAVRPNQSIKPAAAC